MVNNMISNHNTYSASHTVVNITLNLVNVNSDLIMIEFGGNLGPTVLILPWVRTDTKIRWC